MHNPILLVSDTNFSEVLEKLKLNKTARRVGWPSGEFIKLYNTTNNCKTIYKYGETISAWKPSTEDLFAEDWYIFEITQGVYNYIYNNSAY